MNTLTALERAKHFVQHNAAKTALVILPLAMAAPANAASITFDAVGATAVASAGGGPGSVTLTGGSGAFSQIGADNNGVRFVTVGDYMFNVALDSSGSGFVELILSGTGSGTLDADIPAHFDYSYLFAPGTLTSFSSSVIFSINSVPIASFGSLGPSANSDFLLSGWAPGDPLTDWKVDLRATFQGTGQAGTLALHIPPHSVDIIPQAETPAAAVPEPASLILFATGASVLALRRRRQPPLQR